jgi:uncharacterized sulfatase
LTASAALLTAHGRAKPAVNERPNIVWLSTEDIGPHLGCYGDTVAKTPNLDAFAARGLRYTNAFAAAPVCAANRSSIITGMHSATLGTHHMRSGGEGPKPSAMPVLPPHIRCFPAYLRDAGYYCTNNSKQDYNFVPAGDSWDSSSGEAHWKNRGKDQPFFAVFNFTGTHESQAWVEQDAPSRRETLPAHLTATDPAAITVPPYHVDTPLVRMSWARYYDNIATLDHWVGEHLRAIEEAGLAENTIVFFWSDHGAGLPRCKRWLYDSGTHIPLIVHVPPRWQGAFPAAPATVEDKLVSCIDFAPTVLRLAGLDAPAHMQGNCFLGDAQQSRSLVFAHRDRMDERYDCIRMARDERWLYLRNFMPFKPYNQHLEYASRGPVQQALLRAATQGSLPEGAQWITHPSKPVEELYDTVADPHQIHNVVDDPANEEVLAELRAAMDTWRASIADLGLIPEPELTAYESRFGSRHAALDQLEALHPGFVETLNGVARFAGPPSANAINDLPIAHPEAAIRYWCVVGLGQLGAARDHVIPALDDAEPVVKVAAAHACLMHGWAEEKALAMLIENTTSELEWIRLQAVTALDEAGEKARPAMPALNMALDDRENKYVVRVAQHALHALEAAANEER